jgi:LysR family positive regulator for ilvC
MNIHEIKNFLVLCEILHFQKASVRCNISPSALSRMVQRIEDETGERLFFKNMPNRYTISGNKANRRSHLKKELLPGI